MDGEDSVGSFRLEVSQRAFLQAMLARGCVPEEEARAIHSKLAEASDSAASFDAFWGDIHERLEFVGMAMRRFRFPGDKRVYLGVANTRADEMSKMSNRLDQKQMVLFRAVLEAVACSPGGAGLDEAAALIAAGAALSERAEAEVVALTQGLDAGGDGGVSQSQGPGQSQAAHKAVKGMTLAEKEATLRSLVADQWLWKGAEGRYAVGPRAFLELREFLLDLDLPDAVRAQWERSL